MPTAADPKTRQTHKMTSVKGHKVVKLSARQLKRIRRNDAAKDALGGKLPRKGESWHYITNAKYDFWQIIENAILLLGGGVVYHGSSWNINRENVQAMLKLYDDGAVESLSIVTGIYFKRRNAPVYSQLLSGLHKRGQRLFSFRNHVKVSLLQKGTKYIVMDGSGNYTGNPRLEQFNITNDRGLYEFHRGWIEEMLLKDKHWDSAVERYCNTLQNIPNGAAV